MTNRTEWQMPSQQQTDLLTNEAGCKLGASSSLWNPGLPLLWIINGNCFSPCWGLFIVKFCFLIEAMKTENGNRVNTLIHSPFSIQWHILNRWIQNKGSLSAVCILQGRYWNQVEAKIHFSNVSNSRRQIFIKSL